MPGALEALDDILRQADSGELAAGEAMSALLGSHMRLRNQRRLQTAMRAAPLSAVKTLADFDFSFQPSVKRDQLESQRMLWRSRFLRQVGGLITLPAAQALDGGFRRWTAHAELFADGGPISKACKLWRELLDHGSRHCRCHGIAGREAV